MADQKLRYPFLLRVMTIIAIIMGSGLITQIHPQQKPKTAQDDFLLIENLILDVWEYYRIMPTLETTRDRQFIANLMIQTVDRLSRANEVEPVASEATLRGEARSMLVLALAERILDNPTLTTFYLTNAYQIDGVLEGFLPETREKIKASVTELQEWLATFGYANITLEDFVLNTDWQTIDFEIIVDAKETKTLTPQLKRYLKLASKELTENIRLEQFGALIALKAGKYIIACNQEYVPPLQFEVKEQDTTDVVIRTNYWFKLLLLDEKGKERKLNIYYDDKKAKNLDLSRMRFGLYQFFAKGKYHVPDSLKALQFGVKGNLAQREIPYPGYRKIYLDHGEHYIIRLKSKK